MEKYELVKDINVLYVQAASFPDGIKTAFEKLESVVTSREGRIVFGLSWPGKDGKIMYKAALEEKYPDEGRNFGLRSFIIKKGSYITEPVNDFTNDLSLIGQAFQHLLKHPGIDPNGYCVEWYKGPEVLCMVKLDRS